MQYYSRFRTASVFNECSRAEARPTAHVMRPGQQPMQYCSSFEGGICLRSSCSSITLLDQQSLSQAWIESGNKTLLALLPTASIDNAYLVIGMQFSIGKMIKGRHNLITLYPIDRTDYHFCNLWA